MDMEILSEALSKVNYPGFSRDIVSFGLVRELSFTDGVASVAMELTTGDPSIPARLKQDLLVMHAKEEDQMAMHGMAHPLAVELRSVPLLLL